METASLSKIRYLSTKHSVTYQNSLLFMLVGSKAKIIGTTALRVKVIKLWELIDVIWSDYQALYDNKT